MARSKSSPASGGCGCLILLILLVAAGFAVSFGVNLAGRMLGA